MSHTSSWGEEWFKSRSPKPDQQNVVTEVIECFQCKVVLARCFIDGAPLTDVRWSNDMAPCTQRWETRQGNFPSDGDIGIGLNWVAIWHGSCGVITTGSISDSWIVLCCSGQAMQFHGSDVEELGINLCCMKPIH